MERNPRRRSRVPIGVAIALLLALGLWGQRAMRSRSLPLAAGEGGIVAMPDVVMTDVDRTGRQLVEAGFAVTVRRPATVFEPGGGLRPISLPERVRPFAPGEWSHLVGGQEPAAGTPLRPGAPVTLVAGIHHGAGPFRPWLETHGTAVSLRGDARCRECHAPPYCAGCHDGLRR